MRLDKYLQVSRLVKRRTWAKELCEAGKVHVNGKPGRPASMVRVGDKLELDFEWRVLNVEVAELRERASTQQARQMYTVTATRRRDQNELLGPP
ncbi:MAG TPA: RNA-binding S4 domain-containing protein [Firmicutes bacterium]|nr:RNA-binding S4 domain-containing protein [Bacillota bacterium]